MKLICGRANPELGKQIAELSLTKMTDIAIKDFADHEVFVRIKENVRGEDVFVIQPTSKPANDHLMELLIIIDALRRGFAKSIVPVIPYFGYSRQDRKTEARTPITAKLVANMLESAGAHRVMTMDLHASQIQGFFDIPVDNLFSAKLIAEDILKHHQDPTQLMIVSPDHGGVTRARALANRLGTPLAIVDKRRNAPGESEVMNIIGDPKDRICIMFDDIVDTAGTLCNAAQALRDSGATAVHGYATHGVLSNNAITRINASPLTQMVVCDTIRADAETLSQNTQNKLRYISVAPLFAEAITRIRDNKSVSSLF